MKRIRRPGEAIPHEFLQLRVRYPGHAVPLAFEEGLACPPHDPPIGSYIVLDFGGDEYEIPLGNDIKLDFGCQPDEPVDYTYFTSAFDAASGEYANASLARFQNFGDTELASGEHFEFKLDTFAASYFEPSFFTGEHATASLSATINITIRDFDTGEHVSVTLTAYPTVYLQPSVFVGENAVAGLSTSPVLVLSDFDAGENLSGVLTDAPGSPISVSFFTGENTSVDIATTFFLSPETFFTGENVVAGELDLIENFFVFTGETLALGGLSTETLLTPEPFFTGEHAAFDLKIGPSEYMGRFDAYAGEALLIETISYELTKRLEPRFYHGEQAHGYWTASPYVDTINLSNWPDEDWVEGWIQMDLADDLTTNFEGLQTYCVATLSTRIRFPVDVGTGEVFSIGMLGENELPAPQDIGQGANLAVALESVYNVYLCLGNFVPEADAVDVELGAFNEQQCQDYFIMAGEHVENIVLNVQYALYAEGASGEHVTADLTTDPSLACWMYTGENLAWYDPWIHPRAHTGEYAYFRFEEPELTFVDGANVSVEDIVIEYNVWFLEAGCLPNEYIPSTEDGDLDFSKFNPVPVELDQFRHEIKATCG